MKNRLLISKQGYRWIIAGCIAFVLMVILLNPVFLNSGIKAVGKMVEARLSAFRSFQETFKGLALLSVRERFVAAGEIMFFTSCLFYPLIKVPVELILFATGIYYTFRRKDWFLISIFVFLVIIPISILPFKNPRYLYWIFPFVYVIGGLSANWIKEMWGNRGGMSRKSEDELPDHHKTKDSLLNG
jgi:hypothetical protein